MREAIEQFSRSNMPKYLLRVATQNPPPFIFMITTLKYIRKATRLQSLQIKNWQSGLPDGHRSHIAYTPMPVTNRVPTTI